MAQVVLAPNADAKALPSIPYIIRKILKIDAKYSSLNQESKLKEYSAVLREMEGIINKVRKVTDDTILLDFLCNVVNEYRVKTVANTVFVPLDKVCTTYLEGRQKALRQNSRLPSAEYLQICLGYARGDQLAVMQSRFKEIATLIERERWLNETLVLDRGANYNKATVINFPWRYWRRVFELVTGTPNYAKLASEQKNALIVGHINDAQAALENIILEMQQKDEVIDLDYLLDLVTNSETGFKTLLAAIPNDSVIYRMLANAISLSKEERLKELYAVRVAIDFESKLLGRLPKYIREVLASLKDEVKAGNDNAEEIGEVDENWITVPEEFELVIYDYLLGRAPANNTGIPYEAVLKTLQHLKTDIETNRDFAAIRSALLTTIEEMLKLLPIMQACRDGLDKLKKSSYTLQKFKIEGEEKKKIEESSKELATNEASFLKMARTLAKNDTYAKYIQSKILAATKTPAIRQTA